MKSKYIALIPARSGSKGIIDKNILPWGKTNLLVNTVNVAIESKIFDKIIVSSDSEKYFEVVKSKKIQFHKREKKLAADNSKMIDVIKKVIKKFQLNSKNNHLVLLQPTSPLRKTNHLIDAVELYEKNCILNKISLFSVSPPLNHSNTYRILENGFLNPKKNQFTSRQKFSSEVVINGAIYIANTENILKNNSLSSYKIYPYFMNILDSIDIDSEEEYLIAKLINEKKWGKFNEENIYNCRSRCKS